MFQMKLETLDHPTPNNLDINDRQVFASTILWLEDQKIRAYPIEARVPLRNTNELDLWNEAYDKYKNDIGMPTFDNPTQEMAWILNYAIRLEFLDAADDYRDINAQQVARESKLSAKPSIQNESFFDNMDYKDKDFIAGVQALAAKLKIPHHPNHLIQLEAISRLVDERLATNTPVVINGTPFPFENGNDVMSSGDVDLELPARVLRLLQIQSLRKLQTRINEAIVSVQNITANPKTDTKLSQVGR